VVSNITKEVVAVSDLQSEDTSQSEDILNVKSFCWMPDDNFADGKWTLFGAASDGTVREWTASSSN